MRDAAIAIMREIGVETGGSNVQFAIHPDTGEMIVIEMNPRVSRSSALASKATGFPIAKIAAKLAVGYTLDEIPNDITRETMASFEPTIDYCVVKIPRWTFEKFPETEDVLTTSMKSVGETMAIGRTFREALQKAIRSLEIKRFGLMIDLPAGRSRDPREFPAQLLAKPNSLRLFYIAAAFRHGMPLAEIQRLTRIDPWFLHQIESLVEAEEEIRKAPYSEELLREAKRLGFSDRYLGGLWNLPEEEIRKRRYAAGIVPVYKLVDTCAAEFEAYTPYYYSTYETEDETRPCGEAEGRHPRRRPQPDRPGDRIRLLLRPRLLRPAGGGVREHHGQLQPGDGEHRLRHLRQALLRAGDARGRPPHPEGGEADGRHRPVRRPDPAESCPRPGGGRRPDPRHLPRRDRPRRGPEAFPGDREPPRPPPAGERYGDGYGRGDPGGRADRISGPGPPLLRAGGPLDGDHLRHGVSPALHGPGAGGLPRPPHPDRQVSRGCDRSGRGRDQRRKDDRRRRDHGAHRGGGDPLRGQRLRTAGDHLFAGDPGDDRTADEADRRGAPRHRSDEHPVCDQGRRSLRPRGQSPRLADRPLRQQGDRRPAGEAGDEGDAGKNPAGAGLHEARPAEAHLGEGGRLPLQPVPQCRYSAWSRDEIDGRGDGDRPLLRPRLCEIADGRRLQDAALGEGLPQRPRPLQGEDRAGRASSLPGWGFRSPPRAVRPKGSGSTGFRWRRSARSARGVPTSST